MHHYIGKYLQEYLDEKERPGGDVNTLDIVGLNPAANDQASSQENSLSTSAQATTSLPVPTPSSTDPPAAEVKPPITSERTYSAFLPKENLSAILSTAWEQQSQPQKNFGVVTVTGPVVNQISQQINGGQLLQQQQQNLPLVQGPMQTSVTNKADVTEDLGLVMEQVAQHATKIDPQTGIISQPEQQVWPLTHFLSFSFLYKIIDLPEGQINDP